MLRILRKKMPIILAMIMAVSLSSISTDIALAADITETFVAETPNSTTFSEGTLTFNITGGNLHITEISGWGQNDDFFVDNDGNEKYAAEVFGSFKSTGADFNVNSLYVSAINDSLNVTKNNNILIRGKLDGSTVFTHTLLKEDIDDTGLNNYYTFVDLSSYSSNVIDEVEFEVEANASYFVSFLMIDNFKFSEVAPNDAPVASSVQISGNKIYGQTLTGSYSYSDNDSDVQGTSTYKWYRSDNTSGLNKVQISGATALTYVLQESDVGKYLTFEVTPVALTGTSPGTAVESDYTTVVEKADCATSTGITPVLSGKTDTIVTLTAVSEYEYIIVANDAATSTGTWQDSNVLTGLTATTDYDTYQRVKETATHKASAQSTKLDVTTENPALTGTVGITGTATFNEELTAIYSPGNNTGTLSYQWVRGSSDISLATSQTYTLVADDIGQQISVKISSSVESGTLTSTQTSAVGKADCATVTVITPVLSSKMDTTVTLTAVSEYEYIVVANDAATSPGTWQDSAVFSGLTSTTAYDAYQRVKETATHKASAESTKLDVTTDASILTGTANISGTLVVGQTLTATLVGGNNTGTLSYQWVRGSTGLATATSSTYSLGLDDIGEKISVKITSSVETGTITSAQTAVVEKQDCGIATGITPVLSSKTSTSVTLVSEVGYEYKVIANDADISTGTWQDSTLFMGLTGGTQYDFYQRVKETLAQKPSAESPKLDVTTDISIALTGTASISGTTTYGYTLTANLSSTNNSGTLSYQWVRGSSDISLATSQTYTLTASDVGQQIKVKITSSEETGTITSSATSAISKAVSSPTTGVAPVLSSKTRTTVTLTTYTGYEYIVVNNGASFTTGTWQSSSYFSGLSSGTSYDFYQRKKETSSHYASHVSSKLDIRTNSSSTSTTATPTPTATPTVTVTPEPTATATPIATHTPTPTPIVTVIKTTLTPQTIQDGTKEGTVIVEIKVSDLPAGTRSIKTSDNSVIDITSTDSVYITVNEEDINNGVLEIVTINEEGVAFGAVTIDIGNQKELNDNKLPIWLKIITGIVISVIVFTGIYIIGLKRRRY